MRVESPCLPLDSCSASCQIVPVKQVERPFSTALEGHRTAPSEAVECGSVPRTHVRFVLSAASKAPRGVNWNVPCRDFGATSCPAGRTYFSRTNLMGTPKSSGADVDSGDTG
jgi:hypothetical protein